MPAVTRVVIAEDGVLLREGLAGVLSRFGFDVVAGVGDAAELMSAVAEHRPDLVVTDIRMPPDFTDEGLRAAVRLRNEIIQPIRAEGRAVRVGASFGIGWAHCGMTADEVLKSADERMYVEKRSRPKQHRRAG